VGWARCARWVTHTINELHEVSAALPVNSSPRRPHPHPLARAEAQGGLHIVEQSLWNAIPTYLRRMSNALKKHTGRDLPLSATPFKFGSWMGGDRDGNPNVTAQVQSIN